MKVEIITTLCIIFFQQYLIVKIQGKDTCSYYTVNNTIGTMSCSDDCCSILASSMQTACCSSVSLSTLAIPFFVIAGLCMFGICIIYCRPLWKILLCGYRCPCRSRSRDSPRPMPANDNPVYVVNNDDLPDYETITKDSSMKDVTPPPYNFVATHPTDFGIDPRVPSAPPQYYSRRSSLATTNADVPIN